MSHLSALPRRVLASLLATALVIALAALPVWAGVLRFADPDGIGEPTELARLQHPTPAADDQFGQSVAVSGRWAVVGTPFHAAGADPAVGRASAYRWSPNGGWGFVQDLPVNLPSGYDYTGWSVAASGDQLFVGANGKWAPGAGKMGGLVYVYHATDSAITREQTLSVSAADGLGQFGRAIAVNGDTMVISAPMATVGTVGAGAVFVFKKGPSGWVEAQRFNAPVPEAGQLFGESVAIHGDDLVVGSPDCGPGEEGRIYSYRRSAGGTWSYFGDSYLVSPGSNDRYGASVSLSNGLMAVGAPGRETIGGGADAGVAYISRWNGCGWQSIANLESPSSPHGAEQFGVRTALSEDTLLVASLNGPGSAAGSPGAVYQYTVDPDPIWPPTFKGMIYAMYPGVSEDDRFGSALAFDGDTMLAGGPLFDAPSFANAGAVWFFGGLRTARVRTGKTLTVPMPGVLGNDYSDAGTMTASSITAAAHGTAIVNADGSWTYAPTGSFVGTDTFRYRATDGAGSSDSTVTVRVYPTATKFGNTISIKSNLYSVSRSKTFNLTGVLKPGRYLDPCVVYVKKPGSGRWSYSSARLAYSANRDGSANWWYRYAPKLRGTYAFKANFAGDAARAASWSGIVYVRVR